MQTQDIQIAMVLLGTFIFFASIFGWGVSSLKHKGRGGREDDRSREDDR